MTINTRKKTVVVAAEGQEFEYERQRFDLEYGNSRRVGDDTLAIALDAMEADARAFLAPRTVYELRGGVENRDVVAWYANGEIQRLPLVARTDEGIVEPLGGYRLYARQETPPH